MSKNFDKAMLSSLNEKAGVSIEIYSRNEKENEYYVDGLMDEIAANATESFLNDPEKFLDSISKDRSFGQKLCDFVNEFVKYLKDMFSHYDAKSTEAQVLLSDINQLEKAEQLWREAFEKSSESAVENAEGKMQYSKRNLINFVDDVKSGKYRKELVISETISPRLADDISKLFNREVSTNCKNIFAANEVTHIEKRHGKNGLADHSMSKSEDYATILDVLNDYTDISLGNGKSSYKNGDGTRAKNIELKEITKNGEKYVIEAVPIFSDRVELRVISAYTNKKETSQQTPDAYAPGSTSKNATANKDVSINNSISNADEKSNTLKKFSLNKNFEKEYDAWDHKDGNKHFILGTTSDALKEIGVGDKTVYMDAGKIIQILNKHAEMNDTLIKKIPDIIENPIMIMESSTNAGRITMFGETVSATNKPILVAMELNPTQPKGLKISDLAVVVSAYGKDGAQNFINKSNMLWINPDKKRPIHG